MRKQIPNLTKESINMSHHNQNQDLIKENSHLKEKDSKREIWPVDITLGQKYSLKFVENAFLCMIILLQHVYKGNCYAGNHLFRGVLGIKDEWIRTALIKFQEMGLLWYYVYPSKDGKGGKERYIVTPESIRTFQEYLASQKEWDLLDQFRTEFALTPIYPHDLRRTPKKQKKEAQVVDSIEPPNSGEKDRVPPNSGDRVPPNSGDHINTTYLLNNINDVTGKGAEAQPAPSAAAHVVSLCELKKELGNSYSEPAIEIGVKWYEIQSPSKKAKMNNPIACISNALKKGYAQTEVAAYNKEVAAKLAQKQELKEKDEIKKSEMCANEKLAHQLVKNSSHLDGFSYKMDSTCFRVFNHSVEKVRDPDSEAGGSISLMPDGTKRYGNPAIRVDFSLPPKEFREALKKFFNECLWNLSQEKQMRMRL